MSLFVVERPVLVATVRIVALALIVAAVAHSGLQSPAPHLLANRSLLHAHNAYPEDGRWRDRIDRALATGLPRGDRAGHRVCAAE